MKYLIRETVTYEVEADSPEEAYTKVLNTDGGLVAHFTAVEEREIHQEVNGRWQEIPEPDMEW